MLEEDEDGLDRNVGIGATSQGQQLMSRSRRDSLEDTIFEHIEEMERWAKGEKSHINMVNRTDASAADIAVMDCQEVLIHSACAQAYASVLATLPHDA